MMTNEDAFRQQTINPQRRTDARFNVGRLPFNATWLAEHEKVNGGGVMLDLSSGGFGGRMIEPPVVGHLLHTKFRLPVALDEQPEISVEADARVCGRAPVWNGAKQEWMVHFAIESIHPADEMRLARAIQELKYGVS
jgi:hypothetical protein